MSVRKAALSAGVPCTTLQDQVLGNIAPTTTTSGPISVFSAVEEDALVSHIIKTARFGYDYIRFRLRVSATDTASHSKKDKNTEKLLSDALLTKFLHRHAELKVKKPR